MKTSLTNAVENADGATVLLRIEQREDQGQVLIDVSDDGQILLTWREAIQLRHMLEEFPL
jgi:hypothetical protein